MTIGNRMFSGGQNIALRIPPQSFDDRLRFCRGPLWLWQLNDFLPSRVVEFESVPLWPDPVETITQTDVCLALRTPDTKNATAHPERSNMARCDAVESLPEGFDGFRISGPGNIVQPVHGPKTDV